MNHVTDIVQIKHEVLKATAAYAFAGTLYDEGKDKIPYDLIQGIKPQLRCCVWFCRVTDYSRRRFRRTSERIVDTPQHDSYRRPVRARIHPRLDADGPPYLPPESG